MAVTWQQHIVCKQKGICVSASALSHGWLFGGEVGSGGTGRWMGGVSVLPRAQGWCGRALGSSGTWLALEFYCEPARAWHSHENGYGRTEGRKERRERMEDYREGWGQQKREADAGRGRVVGAARFIFVVFGCLQGEQFKSRVSSRV